MGEMGPRLKKLWPRKTNEIEFMRSSGEVAENEIRKRNSNKQQGFSYLPIILKAHRDPTFHLFTLTYFLFYYFLLLFFLIKENK